MSIECLVSADGYDIPDDTERLLNKILFHTFDRRLRLRDRLETFSSNVNDVTSPPESTISLSSTLGDRSILILVDVLWGSGVPHASNAPPHLRGNVLASDIGDLFEFLLKTGSAGSLYTFKRPLQAISGRSGYAFRGEPFSNSCAPSHFGR